MEYQDEECDYTAVIDTITNMFGNVINKDVILTIVESCGGDLNLSVDAIMNITSDSSSAMDNRDNACNQVSTSDNEIDKKGSNSYQGSTAKYFSGESSYATIALKSSNIVEEGSRAKHAIHNKRIKNMLVPNSHYFWTDKVREIIANHKKGFRLMIIMRGAPGSGKTSLARELIEETIGLSYIHFHNHIFSADDYFMVRGKYLFDRYKLAEAHACNQNRVKMAASQGLSPIIVDNTNIEFWEMEPYVRDGVMEGYIIEVLEPSTPWAWNVNELSKRNIHNVPKTTINRMLENYCHDVSGEILLDKFVLHYPNDKVPPVLRTLPIFNPEIPSTSLKCVIGGPLNQTGLYNIQDENCDDRATGKIIPKLVETAEIISEPGCSKDEHLLKQENYNEELTEIKPISSDETKLVHSEQQNNEEESVLRDKLFVEAQKRLDELQKEELEWELNESWSMDSKKDENVGKENATQQSTSVIKPKRSRRTIDKESLLAENLRDTVNECKDWSSISMFMTPWDNPDKTEVPKDVSECRTPVDKVSCGTYLEKGDMDPFINITKYKVISATPRNINEFYVPFNKEKIPDKRMLDKSSMTNENIFEQHFRCQNEEKHFTSFKKLFPKVATADLRDIFDKCCGNVNWAVEIVLDSMDNKLLHTVENEELADSEEDNLENCQCLAAYNIIPGGYGTGPLKSDTNHANNLNASKSDADLESLLNAPGCSTDIVTQSKKKIKKVVSDDSMLLKSQFEQNFVISDNHYSEHCLKIKKMRHGVKDIKEEDSTVHSVNPDSQELHNVSEIHENNEVEESDGEESVFSMDECEKIVPVNVSMEFIKVLDRLFNRDMIYPSHIEPKLNVRLSLLNELNAVWMESLMYQFEDHAINATKRDEELARELAMKEAELLQAGKEPAVPDLKEIMDLELALNLYQKDVDDWKNHQPTDIAAKLSREKLFNLFPDVPQDTLMELLMAHDNNFQETVEVLLISMGKNEIVNKADGVKKFIMEKEIKRQQKVLEQERKALSEVEWPLLTKGETIEMSTVLEYREKAEKHLQRRNANFQKAQEYIKRGMTNVASYYSDVSSYHRQKYEYANSMAAVSLIQMNTTKNPNSTTIDLHYLHVPEALESLDIFIDFHIQKMKESQAGGGPRSNSIYFITGRGLHSAAGPRIKPAVTRRLRERKLRCNIRNPGLLTTKISADDLLSHQLNKPHGPNDQYQLIVTLCAIGLASAGNLFGGAPLAYSSHAIAAPAVFTKTITPAVSSVSGYSTHTASVGPISTYAAGPAVTTYGAAPALATYAATPAVSYASAPVVTKTITPAVSSVSSYSTHTAHGGAAYSAYSAPIVAKAIAAPAVATYAAAPAITAYGAAPAITAYGAAPAVTTYGAAPIVTKTITPAVSSVSSYSTHTAHGSPAVAAYSTPIVAKTIAAPAVSTYAAGPLVAKSYGALGYSTYGAPAYSTYGAPAYSTYGAPAYSTYGAPAYSTYAAGPLVAKSYGALGYSAYGAPGYSTYAAGPLVTKTYAATAPVLKSTVAYSAAPAVSYGW